MVRMAKAKLRWYRNRPAAERNLVIALISAAAVILVGIIGYQGSLAPVRLQIRTTQTAEARATALASALAQTPAGLTAPTAAAVVERTEPPAAPPTAPPATPTPGPSEPAAPAATAPPLEATPTPLPTGIPRTPLPFEALFFACRDNLITHGGASLVVSPVCPGVEREDSGRSAAMQLAWAVPDPASFTGCTISLETIAAQAPENRALVFWARAADPGETVSIKLLDAAGEHARLVRLSPGWQQVVLSFLQDFPDLDLSGVQTLTLGIDYDPGRDGRKGRGSACFSQIGFGSP